MRIVFYANSKLAIPTFQYLVMNRWIVGLCLSEKDFELKDQFQQIAQWSQIPVLEVNAESMDKVTTGWLKLVQPSMGLVFTFPYKISASILNSIEHGFFNAHFGKLPKYRGPEPLFWNMMNEEKEVVITIHKMNQKFDSGPIAYEEAVSIGENDSYGVMQRKLSQSAVGVVNSFLGHVQSGTLKLVNQQVSKEKALVKPVYHDVRINWELQSAQQIAVLIRAVNPWNKGVITYCDGKAVKILLGSVAEDQKSNTMPPGSFVLDENQDRLRVATIEGYLHVQAFYLEDGFYSAKDFYESISHKQFSTELEVTV